VWRVEEFGNSGLKRSFAIQGERGGGGGLGLAAMVTRASPFLASPAVALLFGSKHTTRSSAVRSFKQSELPGAGSVGFAASELRGSSSFAAEVKRVARIGKTPALLFPHFSRIPAECLSCDCLTRLSAGFERKFKGA
jgi:hypothetical protein